MCLTIPKQVLSIKNGIVTVKSAKTNQEVGSILEVKKGDWVLTQNNIIVKKINERDARKINKLLDIKYH